MPDRTFTIFGAGLAGALLAARLARSGHAVHLFERRPDPRVAGAERGRSINLALSTRGLEALRAIGLADDALRIAIPMRGRMIHPPPDHAGNPAPLAYQPYSPDHLQAINSISRADLNILLLNAAHAAGVPIVFNTRCTDVDFPRRTALAHDTALDQPLQVPFETLLAADGAFSAVRTAMTRLDRFNYEQSYLSHGYKELTIPPGPSGAHLLEKHALHIWPRRSYMLIALPNLDGSFTCTLFAPFAGPDGFDAVDDPRRYFERRFPDALALMPTLPDDWAANPTSSLVTIRCSPWRVRNIAALVGDAAHAVVPFYGQGMNAAFESALSLADHIDRDPDLDRAFAAYESDRKPHTDTLADLAVENFIEMRDKVGDPAFLRRKRLEQRLARLFPRHYLPLYSMVTFSTIPYAHAVARARRQDRAVRAIALALILLILLLAAALFALIL